MVTTSDTLNVKGLVERLDISNADHIALWIEANTIPDEPMNQCASWLACRIVEAHEAALAQLQAENERRDALLREARGVLGDIPAPHSWPLWDRMCAVTSKIDALLQPKEQQP